MGFKSCQSEKLRCQHHRTGWLRSCSFPARHSNQSVAVPVRNDQEIRRTPRADLHVNKNLVFSSVQYRSSTTAAVWTHICLADVTKDVKLCTWHALCRAQYLSLWGHAFSVQMWTSITHRLVFVAGLVKCRSSFANRELAFCSHSGCSRVVKPMHIYRIVSQASVVSMRAECLCCRLRTGQFAKPLRPFHSQQACFKAVETVQPAL